MALLALGRAGARRALAAARAVWVTTCSLRTVPQRTARVYVYIS